MCIDELASGSRIRVLKNKMERELHYRLVTIAGQQFLLAKPLTYMNDSGRGVRRLQQIFGFAFADMILVYDDMDTDLGEIRIREKGSAGTHKGMKSVIACSGTQEFPRVRIGIRRPEASIRDKVKYVLTPFRGAALERLCEGVSRAADAVADIAGNGIHHAMNSYNRRTSSLLLGKEAKKP